MQPDAKPQVALRAKDLFVRYRAVEALSGLNFTLEKGKILTLIGANGAGKSTTLRALSGLVKPAKGEVFYRETSIAGMAVHQIVRMGLSHVPEGRGIFLNLSVFENLDLGSFSLKAKGRKASHAEFNESLEHVLDLFPRLKERLKQNAGTLSGGEQQMLAIGRALMSKPEVLLLDEPSLGLAPQIIEKIFEIIKKINKEGMSILLVEQNAVEALEVADSCIVLETGKTVASGDAKEILRSDVIRQAYLG